jgi:DDE superfamily endonuclease
MLLFVRRWLPQRPIVVVAESSDAALELLHAVREAVTVVTRLRLDAALYEPAAVRQSRHMGRPRKKGQRWPTLQQVLAAPKTDWQRGKIAHW